MSVNHTRDILVFAGQGSNQHLVEVGSPDSLRELLGGDQQVAFSAFLDRGRDALRGEYASTQLDESILLGGQVGLVFEQGDALLVPPVGLQSHPIFETISLYSRHILELMLYQSQRDRYQVSETSGICTGILPAILAAAFTSYDSGDFVRAAVEGLRLAFWIGVRAASAYTEPASETLEPSSCVLSVFGISDERMRELLKAYTEESEVSTTLMQHDFWGDVVET